MGIGGYSEQELREQRFAKERMKRAVKIAEQVLQETGLSYTVDALSVSVSILAMRIYDDIHTPKSE
ncbi:MAG: hypothetical protein A2931_04170 [Candidatus Niyogibacteria bacterium RIFCSPLOWO2_01_FULL_45_48]|uniref:Uncharacterized protein n=3 Tax=Parcubacteria group TaxID=1794811 RepID=A0A1G2EXX5_9BACT|nr:MAG: hypothetical protein A2835_00375 [Candidatus Niyogibacteria bacterium RIFCSPHIGHO2_01_FULL_45_28]OGZ30362.1 MAG: hypothetical protein A3J00_02830 [Candidatus Niyogibacteria bacterium RIFCSPLOWO2_02_FULL_45_13]OGZ30399.1 MAG: hypothetical protein A2931_04170 [Candidatus Niyogibacteria bacterium RIFCSPLOWO2_01_FULL_45_48]OHA68010.1 MAG: hypothetical protein A3D59_00130 [Candidatus Wildermuthbacteria bacterium RIFCSPHIGHO2_02_FULL_47_17]